MGKIQRRRSISVRPEVYSRLMHYIRSARNQSLSCSGVTETALTKLLDDAGVPENVDHYGRPSDPPSEPAHTSDSPDRPACFTF